MTALLRLLSRRGEPSRRVRRVLVVLAGVAIAAIGPILVMLPREAGLLVMVGLVGLLSVPLYALSEFRRTVFRGKNPDERERQRRGDAYRLSYRVVEYGVLLVALLFAFSHELARIPGWDWFAVWFIAFGYVFFLPSMVFAWREPDVVD